MIQQDSSDPTGVTTTSPRGDSAVVVARDRKADAALAMRQKLMDWDEIAQVLGYPTGRACLVATEKALQRELKNPETQELMRRLASDRYDKLLKSIWKRATNGEDPDHLAYVQAARGVMSDHRQLHGYDAPKQYVVSSPTSAQLEQWVAGVSASEDIEIEEGDIFETETPIQSTESPETAAVVPSE